MNKKERLFFKKDILSNGLTLYSQFDPSVEFADVTFIAPVGSAHNYGDIIPGTFHFLEHLLMSRSRLCPVFAATKERASLFGGRFGATTRFGQTCYELQIPSLHFSEMFEDVLSHVFYPNILLEDISREKGVVANERKRRATFYPAQNERSHYVCTEWKNDCAYPLEQIFGTDQDLERMDLSYLEKIHRDYYMTDRTCVVIVGNFNHHEVMTALNVPALASKESLIEPSYQKTSWKRPRFHEFTTSEVSRFQYHVETIYPTKIMDDHVYKILLNIIGQMLGNYSYGSLMQWLRHEKGWLYEINTPGKVWMGTVSHGLMIPLNSMDQVELVRHELMGRIFDTLIDEKTFQKAKQQIAHSSVFWYQTTRDRAEAAVNQLQFYGETRPESKHWEIFDSIEFPMLRDVFEKSIQPNIGELLMIPVKK
ncbi:MAG: insulinase family protein [Candidatus Pacebacteria bacterium]|nr:insulinase family protein [Candidatus Paceibacterota bacterium]